MNTVEAPLDRREKRKQETRSRIEEAAYRLFKREGIDETSIEMICQEADVARRTFYSHYANKQTLLAGLGVSRLYSQSEPMLQGLMTRHSRTRERLEAMIDYIEASFSRYEAIDRQLILAAPASLASDPEQQRQISHGAIDSFARLISAGQAAGDASDRFSAEILAAMIVGTLNSLSLSWATDADFPIFAKLEEARGMFEALICTD